MPGQPLSVQYMGVTNGRMDGQTERHNG